MALGSIRKKAASKTRDGAGQERCSEAVKPPSHRGGQEAKMHAAGGRSG